MTRLTRTIVAVVPTIMATIVLTTAADWPQILGPTRNGVYSGPPLAATWPTGGPKKVWQKSVGEGSPVRWSPAIDVILFHRVLDQEVVEALRRQNR